MTDNAPAPNGDGLVIPPRPDSGATPDTTPPIFSGPVSMWIGFRVFFFAALLLLISLAGILYGVLNRQGLLADVAMIVGAALFMATALMVLYTVVRVRAVRYTITRRLIEREQGVIFRRVDSLDLGRVKDVELVQSLFERLTNTGTIIIYSSDRTDPLMRLESLPAPRPIYERLRDAIIEISQKRGVVPM